MNTELPVGLTTPTLVVNVDVLKHNIARMGEAARSSGFILRPHARAHKGGQVAEEQERQGQQP